MIAARWMRFAARRRVPYDAQVEYLESSGTQYIDTGIKADNTTSVSMYAYFTAASTGCLFGCYHRPSGGTATRYMAQKLSSQIAMYTDTRTSYANFANIATGTHTITADCPSGLFAVDSVTVSRAVQTFSQDANIHLLARLVAIDGSDDYVDSIMPSGTRLGACTITQNGVRVRDFIPVRKDGVGYLYDNVSGALFGSPVDAFAYGSDVTS